MEKKHSLIHFKDSSIHLYSEDYAVLLYIWMPSIKFSVQILLDQSEIYFICSVVFICATCSYFIIDNLLVFNNIFNNNLWGRLLVLAVTTLFIKAAWVKNNIDNNQACLILVTFWGASDHFGRASKNWNNWPDWASQKNP